MKARVAILTLVAGWPGVTAGQELIHEFTGDQAKQWFGHSVGAAGDLDGDGHDDVMASAVLDNANGAESGLVRVFSGADGTVMHTFLGAGTHDWFGQSLAGVGDANNDGFVDLAVGAHHFADIIAEDGGSARVISGQNGTVIHLLPGGFDQGFFGYAVHGAGDTNADGWDDVLIGVSKDDTAAEDAGSVLVYSGRTGGLLTSIFGAAPGERFGFSLSKMGDVNGDAIEDWAVGAPGDSQAAPFAGRVDVYAGGTFAWIRSHFGDSASDIFGEAIAGGMDLDVDGVPDLLVGSRWEDAGGVDAGAVRGYSGSDGSLRLTVYGASPGIEFGGALDFAGDIDRDGVPDFVAGAHRDGAGGFGAGSVTAVSGQTGATLFRIDGAQKMEFLGRSVAMAGDVDDDGAIDVIAGGYLFDGPAGKDSGVARVLTLACDDADSYGFGCPGSGGFVPLLAFDGCAVPDAAVELSIASGLGGADAFLAIGLQATAAPLGGGCTLDVAAPFLLVGPIALTGVAAGEGEVSIPFLMPPTVSSLDVKLQAFVIDPAVAIGFSSTAGLRIANDA